jgi:hypothetical protein
MSLALRTIAIARIASRMWKALGFLRSSPTLRTRCCVSPIMSVVIAVSKGSSMKPVSTKSRR